MGSIEMTAAVLLADGFEEIEAITPIDLLRRAEIAVSIISVGSGRTVRGAHDIQVGADITIEELQGASVPDCVILPGGMPGASNLFGSTPVRDMLARVRAADGIIAAICAAPSVVLAPLGYLHGKRFTCYPTYKEHAHDGEYREEAVVRDGWLITSRGAGTAIAFSAEIIAALKNRQVADEIVRAIVQKIE